MKCDRLRASEILSGVIKKFKIKNNMKCLNLKYKEQSVKGSFKDLTAQKRNNEKQNHKFFKKIFTIKNNLIR